MNNFMIIQCKNMVASVRIFYQTCEMAAKKDDGQISKDEQKTLKAIRRATDAFIKELTRLYED